MPTLTRTAPSAAKANKKENKASPTRAASQSSTLSDNRARTLVQMKVVEAMSQGPQSQKIAQLQAIMPGNSPVQKAADEEEVQMKAAPVQKAADEEEVQMKAAPVQKAADEEEVQMKAAPVQKAADEEEVQMKAAPVQKKENNTGLPDGLKSGVENLSGVSLDDVKVHTNSDQPAQMQAHAFAQGTDIHVAPGQEQHLPHEAWHVVQQKQDRVKPTSQMKEKIPVNDDKGLEHEADVMGIKSLKLGNEIGQLKENKKLDEISTSNTPIQGAFYSGWFGGKSKEQVEDVPKKELKTDDGYKVNPEVIEKLKPEEQEAVKSKSSGVIGGLNKIGQKGAGLAVSTALGAKSVVELADPNPSYLENLKTVSQNSGEAAAKGGFAAIMGSIFGIGTAIKGIYDNTTAAFAKWDQWTAFQESAKQGVDEAIYGLTKVWKGFWTKVGGIFESVLRLTEAIMLLTPAAPIAAAITVGHKIKDGISFVFGAGKSIYQYFKGEKKIDNASSLVSKAAAGDEKALGLVKKLIKTSKYGSYKEDWQLINLLNAKGHPAKIQKIIEESMTGTGV